jgi:hypothetical protein
MSFAKTTRKSVLGSFTQFLSMFLTFHPEDRFGLRDFFKIGKSPSKPRSIPPQPEKRDRTVFIGT